MTPNMPSSGRVDVLSRAIPVPEAGCWLWVGAISGSGYGRVFHEGRMWQAHRLSWVQFNGDIPDGTFVCHRCDTPSCVNPSHLFLGSPRDNVMDMVAKGRHWLMSKTHCDQGHQLEGSNLRVNGRNERVCVECYRSLNRQWERR